MSTLLLRPLLMFTGRYPDQPSLDREGVANTATLLEKAFFTKKGLNVPQEVGCVIKDEKYISAKSRIRNFLQKINTDEELVLVYYCGHGFPDYQNNAVRLAMSDTTDSNHDYCGISHRWIIDELHKNSVRNYIIILDCCGSGFLCDMGEEKTNEMFSLTNDDNISGAVYISSTQKNDKTSQIEIEDKYYVPFSYFFGNVLLGEYNSTECYLSIQEIYNYVQKELKKLQNYTTKCSLQSKGNIKDTKLFKINKQKPIGRESGFWFGDYFSIIKLKVLLVKTAIYYPIKYDDFGVPLGLWMLKGHLSTSGLSLEVDIFDERLELQKCGKNENAKKEVKSKFDKLVEEYDVIGISMSSSEVWPALEKFEIAKKANKITFCGGIFTSSNESYLLNTGLIDYVVPGVSTVPLTNLLARLSQDKRNHKLGQHIISEYGVASKDNINQFDGVWIPTVLPTMRKKMWIEIINNYGQYLEDNKTHKKRMDVYTARGCKRNCAFCSVQKESKQTVLYKETHCVIDEIRYLESQGIEYFSIKDEDLLTDPNRMFEILDAVHKEGVLFKIRSRIDEMIGKKEYLERLRRLGVVEIQYGIESPDIHLQRNLNKGFPRNTNENDLAGFICSHEKIGIKANCSFILGIAGEDSEYYDTLFEFIKKIYNGDSHPKVYINFITPHPINSQFPLQNYRLATNNLNFFTHKFPVCYDQNSKYGIRKKMLETYDRIVEYTSSSLYNPPISLIPDDLKTAFLSGKSKLTSKDMPQYSKGEK